MKQKEIKNKYSLQSGDTTVTVQPSLPKLAKALGCNLSWIYKHKPKADEAWSFNYKDYQYTITVLNNN
jgi:hypothetical protein